MNEEKCCHILTSDELLERIFSHMEKLFQEKELSKVLNLLTDLGKDLVGSDRCSFWYWDKRTHQIWTLAAHDVSKITIPENSGLVGYSIINNEILIINDPYNDERFNSEIDKKSGYKTETILVLPVTNTSGEVIGAYQAVNKIGPYGFSMTDCKRLSLAAAFCEKTLESHMLYSEALMDQLTGIKNRRGFYDHYDKKIVPIMYNHPVSLIICDIDYFKKVNDTYGHNVGDAVLIHVAEVISKACRVDDGLFRWGGEEFIILLPKTCLDESAKIAERIRSEIENSVCSYDNLDVRVTLSMGVAELIPNVMINDIIKTADDKLYKAKEQGRNRVII